MPKFPTLIGLPWEESWGEYMKRQGDPPVTESTPDTPEYTFHGHAKVGADMTDVILRRLGCLGKKDREEVVALVSDHMRAHAIPSMGRKSLAPMLRARHAPRLLKLMEADVFGRQPIDLEGLRKAQEVAEAFYVNDVSLRDLGISPTLVMTLDDERQKEGCEKDPLTGRMLGVKLKIMQSLLDKDPTKTRAELLAAVGYKETTCETKH